VRITVTGATGLIGSRLVAELERRDCEVTVLSRDPERASARLGVAARPWDPLAEPAPAGALNGRDGIVHLAGENVAQRWTQAARRRIRDSRVRGTANLVEGLRRAEARPAVLVSGSAVGIYGEASDQPVTEGAPPGAGFLAEVCVAWERAAAGARELGLRLVCLRTGVVLDRSGGALARMLPPFRLGLGGPVAGGRQYVPWIHPADQVGIIVAALADRRWEGPVNACARHPATNRELTRALGRALHRPAALPIPGLALRVLYGEMAGVITAGQRAVPERALSLGYRFSHPELEAALRDALGSG
jgi:uncharacterized protein (TIGR01777 family)